MSVNRNVSPAIDKNLSLPIIAMMGLIKGIRDEYASNREIRVAKRIASKFRYKLVSNSTPIPFVQRSPKARNVAPGVGRNTNGEKNHIAMRIVS